MVFGGHSAVAPPPGDNNTGGKISKNGLDMNPEDTLDTQDLLVENSRLRRQLATATEKERRTQEEKDDLCRQVMLLQQQNADLMASHKRFEAEFEQAGTWAEKEANIEGNRIV